MGWALLEDTFEEDEAAPADALSRARARWGSAEVVISGTRENATSANAGALEPQEEAHFSISGMLLNLSYGAWGEPQASSEAVISASPFGYTGRWGGYTDLRVNGVLNWNRWYSWAQGRWVSRDPIGIKDDRNQFRYVRNTPNQRIDPTGKACGGPGPAGDFFIPDKWFEGPCSSHDSCYGSCGEDKGGCDQKFLDDMLATCEGLPIQEQGSCKQWAWLYYDGVRHLGKPAYDLAQKTDCALRMLECKLRNFIGGGLPW